MPREGLFCLTKCLGGFYGSKKICMNKRTQVSQLEQCSVAMISFINLISLDFNIVADQCTVSLHRSQRARLMLSIDFLS